MQACEESIDGSKQACEARIEACEASIEGSKQACEARIEACEAKIDAATTHVQQLAQKLQKESDKYATFETLINQKIQELNDTIRTVNESLQTNTTSHKELVADLNAKQSQFQEEYSRILGEFKDLVPAAKTVKRATSNPFESDLQPQSSVSGVSAVNFFEDSSHADSPSGAASADPSHSVTYKDNDKHQIEMGSYVKYAGNNTTNKKKFRGYVGEVIGFDRERDIWKSYSSTL